MKRNVLTIIAEATELAKELHRFSDVSKGVVRSLTFSYILRDDPVWHSTGFERLRCVL